jgi:prepilin signal peptidase PulO-like enzyme (type II secretory pathway)
MSYEPLALMSVRLIIGLVIGLVLGSFTTMLSYRLPRRLSIISPPSKCPHCQKSLKPRDLIPVFSWLITHGRCRFCKTKIGARYLVIEIFTTLAVMTAFALLGFTPFLLVVLIALIALITAVTIKIEHRPDDYR